MASCAACWRSRPRTRRKGDQAQRRAGAGFRARHQPGDRRLLGYTVKPIPAREDGTVDAEAVKAALGPEVAAIMLTNPNTCGLFERDVVEIAARGARGRRLLLLRRRQLQRHRRQGAAGRSRRRRHAHQPAQDLLHAARRRRSGRRPGGAVGGAGAVRAAALSVRQGDTFRLVEHADEARDGRKPSAA